MSIKYNDFVIRFANVNGSGSASANGMFAKALFRMGIPVATRNIFPSNIQGLPTWFEVRVNENGYLGRREGVDIMVAMNAETYTEDVASVKPGGYLLYDNSKPLAKELRRSDITDIGIPIARLLLSEFDDIKQRGLFKNIVYLGALAELLNIEFDVITGMVSTQYKGKDQLIKPNIHALEIGRTYAREYMESPLPIQVRRVDKVVGGEEAEQVLDVVQATLLVRRHVGGHTRLGGVAAGTAQFLERDLFAGDGLHHVGSRDEHVRCLVDHEDEVGHGRGVDRPSGGRAHDGADLGHHPAGHRVAVEDVAVAGQGVHALLDAGPAGVAHAHHRATGLHGHVHGFAYLFGLHFPP